MGRAPTGPAGAFALAVADELEHRLTETRSLHAVAKDAEKVGVSRSRLYKILRDKELPMNLNELAILSQLSGSPPSNVVRASQLRDVSDPADSTALAANESAGDPLQQPPGAAEE